LKTLNPVSAFSLMRCISFARPNYITKLSPVCQPLGEKFFFDDVMESDEGRETGFLPQYLVVTHRFRKNPVSESRMRGEKPGFYDNIPLQATDSEKTRFLRV